MKYIAFYLPQFHPIPENDRAWGKGFTEWTNVTKSAPLFSTHFQPRRPADLGYYDLRTVETQWEQVGLAKKYGIHGFCFYYYNFGGRKPLERPIAQYLAHKELDLPFCLCFANENWSKRWDGGNREMIFKQAYGDEFDQNFIQDILPYLHDTRYIQVEGKPLLLVYNSTEFPNIRRSLDRWREEAVKSGLKGLHICRCEHFSLTLERMDPRLEGFDSSYEFPPHRKGVEFQLEHFQKEAAKQGVFEGNIYSYAEYAYQFINRKLISYPLYRGLSLGWDNTARLRMRALIIHHFDLDDYELWLKVISLYTVTFHPRDHQLIFINAWNEWAEGTYLEPDQQHGHSYLEKTQSAYRYLETLFEQGLHSGAEYARLKREALDHFQAKFRKHFYAQG